MKKERIFRIGSKLLKAFRLSFEFYEVEFREYETTDNVAFHFTETDEKAFQISQLAHFLYLKLDI